MITANFGAALSARLKGRDCRVGIGSARLRAPAAGFAYPDLFVISGQVQYSAEDPGAFTNPRIVADVVSPFAVQGDYGLKGWLYRNVPSVQECAIVSKDEPWIEVTRRDRGKMWTITTVEDLNATVTFESLGISIPLAEIYAGVPLNSGRTAETPPQ